RSEVAMVLWIGVDDTDSLSGMCTTFLATEIERLDRRLRSHWISTSRAPEPKHSVEDTRERCHLRGHRRRAGSFGDRGLIRWSAGAVFRSRRNPETSGRDLRPRPETGGRVGAFRGSGYEPSLRR